jgi:diguanylate cyclase (GGDEF)-like protein
MKSRPFGSTAWGLGVTLLLGLVFLAATPVLVSITADSSATSRTARISQRLGALTAALSEAAQPALPLGRYAASGQTDVLRSYAGEMADLQASLAKVEPLYGESPAVRERVNRAGQQVAQALAAARRVLAQPGAGLLSAGSVGSPDETGASTLTGVRSLLDELIRADIAALGGVSASAGQTGPNAIMKVWLAAWGAAFAVLVALMIMTLAARAESEEARFELAAPADSPPPGAPRRQSAPASRHSHVGLAEQLEAAQLDRVTGLLNRHALTSVIGPAIDHSLKKGQTIGLIYIEIDGFKALRGKIGTAAANALLVETGRQLQETFRRNDYIAHIRGGEFAVIVSEIAGRDILSRLEERIREAVAEAPAASLQGRSLKLNIGAAVYPIDGYSDEDLLTAARNDVIFRAGGAAAVEDSRQAGRTEAPPILPSADAPPVFEPTPKELAAEAAKIAEAETKAEDEAEASLSELHALIGKYLAAAKGSADKREQAQVLIGEFKKRA